MMNRKAILFKNALSTIIAVIALVIIFVGVGKLYAIYVNQEDSNAQKLIDSIEGRIDILQEDNAPRSFPFSGFKSSKEHGWSLVSWSKSAAERPDKCYFKSCICICPDLEAGDKDTYVETCQTSGVCRLLEQDSVYLYEAGYLGAKNKERVPVDIIESIIESDVYLHKIDDSFGTYYLDKRDIPIGPLDLYTHNKITIPENFIELEIRKDANKLSVVYPSYTL